MKQLALLIFLIALQLPCSSLERRLAIDIGSSAVKVLIADIDPDQHEIVKVIKRESIPLPIRLDIRESGTEVITDRIRHRLVELLRHVVDESKELGVTEYSCVATAAFRIARNAESAAREVARQTGVDVHVISAKEEAVLGFEATVIVTKIPPRKVVSWDVGGGSQELVALSRTGEYLFYTSPMGSVPFAATVGLKVRRLNPGVVRSPNPLSVKEIDQAIELARREAAKVPDALKARAASPDARVVGIGAIAFLKAGTEEERASMPVYSVGELYEALLGLAGKTDRDLGNSEYAPYAVTNLCLVVGTMRELGIQELVAAQIDLTEALVVYSAYNEPLVETAAAS